MVTNADNWVILARRLGIDIIAPFSVELAGVQVEFTALLPQFGAPAGMVIDADWDIIQPHKDNLLAAGYAFSCVGAGDPPDDIAWAHEMLTDWGWSAASPKPHWVGD